jgi:hypothetical protein
MDSWLVSLGLGQTRNGQMDSTAHVGTWSQMVGTFVVPVVIVGLILKAVCCKESSRAVNATDAPELEELTIAGVSVTQVDTVATDSTGRYVDASRRKRKDAEIKPSSKAAERTKKDSSRSKPGRTKELRPARR